MISAQSVEAFIAREVVRHVAWGASAAKIDLGHKLSIPTSRSGRFLLQWIWVEGHTEARWCCRTAGKQTHTSSGDAGSGAEYGRTGLNFKQEGSHPEGVVTEAVLDVGEVSLCAVPTIAGRTKDHEFIRSHPDGPGR